MANPLVRAVVGIREPGLPIPGQRLFVDGVAVVLARDVAPRGACLAARLVLASVPELELERVGPGGQGKNLMTQAYPENGHGFAHELPDRGDGGRRALGVPRSVGDDNAARREGEYPGRIRVGGDADDGNAAAGEAADD